jgi:hypothetical protein
MTRRKIIAAAVALCALATVAVVGAMGAGGSHSSARGAELAYRPSLPTRLVKGHIADVLTHGREGNRGAKAGDPDAGLDPAAQAYADQAYPFAGIGIAQTRAASSAAGKVHGHAPKHAAPGRSSAHSRTTWPRSRPRRSTGRRSGPAA